MVEDRSKVSYATMLIACVHINTYSLDLYYKCQGQILFQVSGLLTGESSPFSFSFYLGRGLLCIAQKLYLFFFWFLGGKKKIDWFYITSIVSPLSVDGPDLMKCRRRGKMRASKRKAIVKPTDISSLNDDLLLEILSRLPLKPLHTSKCVSKRWYGLIATRPFNKPLGITTGLFIYDHTGQWGYSSNAPGDESEEELQKALDINLSFLPFFPNVMVMGGSKGLLLCVHGRDHWLNFYVCNPLTRKWLKVPMPNNVNGGIKHSVTLDFEPRVSPHFKIIRYLHKCTNDPMRYGLPSSCMELEVFSSQTGKWVKNRVLHGPRASCSLSQEISLNGVVYKLVNPLYIIGYHFRGNSIRVEEIRLPAAVTRASYGCIGEYGGCLYYSYWNHQVSIVWVLRDSHTSRWELKHKICYRNFSRIADRDLGSDHWKTVMFHPTAFLSNVEIVFLEETGGAVVYNYDEIRFRRMEITKPYSVSEEARFKVFSFTPCLVDPSRLLRARRDAME
ncbi:putative F-box protein At1g46984 [Aristolochia californica]|uniref:putative F-box protein At1g46984 n=1 Tax=Aristolochia californica TaxID=171875 RepID=UPI0035D73B99